MFLFLKNNKHLSVILALCFLVTLGYAFAYRIHPVVDARAYDEIGWNLAQGFGYAEDPSLPPQYDMAIIRVGPLFEYMLAGFYTLFGHIYEPIWILHAFLHTLTVFLIFKVALIVFGSHERKQIIGLWAAGLLAFSPDLIEISAMLMTETLYLFLFTLFVYCFIQYVTVHRAPDVGHQYVRTVFLGIIAGLSVLARPPVLFVIPLVYLYLILKQRWKDAIIVTASFVLVFMPWSLQNYQTYGRWMPTGGAGVYNFWIGNYHGASGGQVQPQEAVDFIKQYGVIALQDESLTQFKSFVIRHPFEFIGLTALRINRYFSVGRPMGFWFYQEGFGQFLFIVLSITWSGVLFVLSLLGILLGIKTFDLRIKKLFDDRIGSTFIYLLGFTLLTPLIIFVTVVQTRYRFQIYPLLAVFGGYGAWYALSGVNRYKDKMFLVACSIVAINTLIDVLFSSSIIVERVSFIF